MIRVLRRFVIGLVILVVAAGLGLWGLASYIKPDEQLNLNYSQPDFAKKALNIALSGKAELTISQDDLNNLVKEQLAKDPILGPDLRAEGAKVVKSGDTAELHVNVRYRNRIPFGALVVYRLHWQAPDLVAQVESVNVKDIPLPASGLESIRVPLGTMLPDWLTVRSVNFDGSSIRIGFRLSGKLPLDLQLNG